MPIELNDEKLTAYVLGELDDAERAAVEAALENDDDAQFTVAELQQVVDLAAEVFQAEPKLNRAQRAAIKEAARSTTGWSLWRIKRSLIRVAVTVAVIMLMVSMAIPNLLRSRLQSSESNERGFGNAERAVSMMDPSEESNQLKNLGYIGDMVTFESEVWRYSTDDPSKVYWPGHNTESYDHIVENPFLAVTENPLSTFSIDVDTASYANVRRFLNDGMLPPPGAVRIEELVNYFDYAYAPPVDGTPFASHVTVAACPWTPEHRLARIGLKGRVMPAAERPPSNLVFLVDVSGSMQTANKLPLLKQALRMLAKRLRPEDRLAIAVYASASGLVLPSTPGNDAWAISGALDQLEAGGSTNGGAGIQLAYNEAAEHFIEGGANRVILATDGDFNVGVTNQSDLVALIEREAKRGIFLTVLGVGMGNLKDSTLEQLADKGNGNYAYIDTLQEAQKVLVEQMSGTLVTIAKDVKIQVEFNPAQVAAYRLIGYENRMLAKEDFNDDTKDAGEIGAGHAVTALYELVPAGAEMPTPAVDPLKYQTVPAPAPETQLSSELFTLKLRYKEPEGDTSKLLSFPVTDTDMETDADFRFAAAVASFGMLLRNSEHAGTATFDSVIGLAREGLGEDAHGYRSEFIGLAQKARELKQ